MESVGTATGTKTKRVLVVDDSAFMRHTIAKILQADPELEVVGEARDGEEGLALAAALRPDVVTLDVEMPRMDGLTMLGKLMCEQPMPVVMLSTLTQAGASATLEALDLGAVDFVPKPRSGRSSELVEV
ncbi:MAG: response regulator, partial [Dehalococcoidia bacterium]